MLMGKHSRHVFYVVFLLWHAGVWEPTGQGWLGQAEADQGKPGQVGPLGPAGQGEPG